MNKIREQIEVVRKLGIECRDTLAYDYPICDSALLGAADTMEAMLLRNERLEGALKQMPYGREALETIGLMDRHDALLEEQNQGENDE